MANIPPRTFTLPPALLEAQESHPAPLYSDQSHHPPTPPIFHLTASQELDMLAYPETMHARIVSVLAQAPLEIGKWDARPVVTVEQAVAYIKAFDANIERDKELAPAPVATEEVSPAKSVSKRATEYAAYVEACQARKKRMLELRVNIQDYTSLTAQDTWAVKTRADAEAHIRAYAEQVRAQCEQYIAQHSGLSPIEQMRAELNHLTANVPMLKDFRK